MIPGPTAQEHQVARSSTPSAFSDTECDGGAMARLQAPSPPAVAAPASSPATSHVTGSNSPPSAVPAPPRLGRVSSAAACSIRSAQAEQHAASAGTPLLEAASPSSDRSESGFASCAPPTLPTLAPASAEQS